MSINICKKNYMTNTQIAGPLKIIHGWYIDQHAINVEENPYVIEKRIPSNGLPFVYTISPPVYHYRNLSDEVTLVTETTDYEINPYPKELQKYVTYKGLVYWQ